ncbi:MAG: Holliday junction branch migration protein RuvA [Selenomonadaceae bacterium]|nr:Holliday junction branch migration protein RuvA [Selenomonadaceae bacterium]
MIGYLRGKVFRLRTDYGLIDVNGVGYRVFVPETTRRNLKQGEEASLFVHTGVREDAIILYGFGTEDEYEMFQLLISVSGVGPKVALGILSAITVDKLRQAIRQKETGLLTKLPGIGKKSAERLVLELKDKVGGETEAVAAEFIDLPLDADVTAEAGAALVALGYSTAEATAALKKIQPPPNATLQDTIRLALKELY